MWNTNGFPGLYGSVASVPSQYNFYPTRRHFHASFRPYLQQYSQSFREQIFVLLKKVKDICTFKFNQKNHIIIWRNKSDKTGTITVYLGKIALLPWLIRKNTDEPFSQIIKTSFPISEEHCILSTDSYTVVYNSGEQSSSSSTSLCQLLNCTCSRRWQELISSVQFVLAYMACF